MTVTTDPTVTPTDLVGSAPETATAGSGATDPATAGSEALVEEDLLVEDVSIDGMCGVY